MDTDRISHWVKPELVANIKFATYTSSGKIRKPAIFLGFREDKKSADVVEERPIDPLIIEKKPPIRTSEDSNWPVLEKEPVTSEDKFDIEGKELILTNVEKELWPGVAKADLIQYYNTVSDYILPYLIDRPQSLHVKYIKPTAPGLYIKDMEGRQPKWAEVFSTPRKHAKKGKRDIIDYLVCQDKATLLYMINLGCIDINPWTSRTTDYLHPDFIVIDLDPSDGDFVKAIKTAIIAKKLFDKLKLRAFIKTSGKTGLHIYIPCAGFGFPETRAIAVNFSNQISGLIPGIATSENTISQRGNKLFVDYNQNDEADTVAAPYSVRPAGNPTVSTPLDWKEVNNKLNPNNFSIANILQRIKKKGDLFKDVMNEKVQKSNSQILKKSL